MDVLLSLFWEIYSIPTMARFTLSMWLRSGQKLQKLRGLALLEIQLLNSMAYGSLPLLWRGRLECIGRLQAGPNRSQNDAKTLTYISLIWTIAIIIHYLSSFNFSAFVGNLSNVFRPLRKLCAPFGTKDSDDSEVKKRIQWSGNRLALLLDSATKKHVLLGRFFFQRPIHMGYHGMIS